MPEIRVKPYGAPDTVGGLGVEDERQVAARLSQRADARALDSAQKFLDELIVPPGVLPPPGAASPPADAGGPAGAPARPGNDARNEVDDALATLDAIAAPTPPARGVAADIGRGIVETPVQTIGGMRDAAQSAIDLGDWLADSLNEIAPLGGVQLFDDAGAFKPEYIPAGDARLAPDKTGGKLPAVKEARSVTGGLVRNVAQFLTGFAAAGPVAGATKLAAGTVPRAMVQGALADFTAFDAHQQRLANLLQEVPALRNPVSAYLAADPNDGEIEGRLKNAVEGLGLGVLTEGLLRAIRYVRDARRAANAGDPTQAAARQAAKPRAAQPLDLIGDESRPLMEQGPPAAAEKPVAGAVKDLDLGVPDDVAARSLTREALTPLSEGPKGVYINFARINSDDDVKRVIATTAKAFKDDIDAARRGVRSHKQTAEAAGSVDAWKILSERRAGAPLNAEEALAARNLWEASAAKLLEVADAAAASGTPEHLFQFRKMLAIHKSIQEQVIAARTETARALNAWAIPAGGTGVERLRSIENLLLSNGGAETAQAFARRIAALKDVPHGMEALDDMVAKGVFAKSVDTVKEVFINAILSGPKTHMVNMIGNTAALGQQMIERAVAARASQFIGSGEIQIGEAAAQAYGAAQGIREGMRLFGLALRHGESQFGAQTSKTADLGFTRAISAAHWDLIPDSMLGRAVDGLGAVLNLPTRFLTAADDLFKSVGYYMEINSQAFRQASHEAQDGLLAPDLFKARIAELVQSPPENLRLAATDAALYATFTNKPGKIAEAINALDRKLTEGGTAGGQIGSLALRYIIPFRTTLANLTSYGLERTPLAPLIGRYAEAVAQGGAAADLARTRMALGTFALLGLIDLALDGHVSGAGPSYKDSGEKGTRATMLRSGWQPYAIKAGDRWVSYQRTDPIGMSIAIAADIAEQIANATIDEDKSETIMTAVLAGSAAFGNQMLDKHYTKGLSDIFDVLHNPSRVTDYLARLGASTVVPAGVAEVRRVQDPYLRWTAGFLDELRNKTPGLSSDLPAARDMWGRPRSYQSGLGTVYDAVSPLASRVENPEPIDREALAHDFNLMMPAWALTDHGVKIPLRNRPAVYSRYLEIRGQMKPTDMGLSKASSRLLRKYGDVALLPLLNAIVEGRHRLSADYAAEDGGRNGGKDRMITRIVADYGKAAKQKIIDEFEDVAGIIARKRGGR